MSRGLPSMTALLAVLAVAGYQHRDKLADLLGSAGGTPTAPGTPPGTPPATSAQDNLGGMLGGSSIGAMLSNGIRDLVDRFRQAGQGEAADSWVAQGPNREIPPAGVERAIGADTLAALEQQTGLPRAEILARLSRELPGAVDRYTPDGRLPSAPA